jgi:2-C-methyl-D-erythritol 4-phosphate cytidylyltransferase
MDKFALIVAAGSGQRMGSSRPKQFLPILGRPVIWYTLRAFLEAYDDLLIVLVVPVGEEPAARQIAVDTGASHRITIVEGGASRFLSVRKGLDQVRDPSIVFVHDGVRCLVTTALIHRCYEEALKYGNAVPVLTSTDSIRIDQNGTSKAFDRNLVKIVQTPQTFSSKDLKEAFAEAGEGDFTDEAGVLEFHGQTIHLTEGEDLNLKITRPLDLVIAEKVLAGREVH